MKFRAEIIAASNMNWQLDEWDSEIFPEDFNAANEDDAVKNVEEYLRKIDLNPDDYKIRVKKVNREFMTFKEIRQAKDMTQQELSAQSGINISTIQKIERGKNNLSGAKFSTVLALYRVLGPDVFIAAGMAEEGKSMKEELMKSEHVLRRYNRIMSSKGKSEAEKWLDMLIRSV